MSGVNDLESFYSEHRKAVLGASAGGVVVLVLILRKRAGGANAVSSTAAPSTVTSPTQNSGYYDSTASDVYNSIQPEIEALQQQLSAQFGANSAPAPAPQPGTVTPTVPAPAPSPAGSTPPPFVQTFSIDPSTGMGHALPGVTPAFDAINSLGLDPNSPAAVAIRTTAGVNDAIAAGKQIKYGANGQPQMNTGTATAPVWVPVPLGPMS